MKVAPAVNPTGQPGQILGNIEVGSHSVKLERARAIARGEKVAESAPTTDHQANRVQQNVRSLKMRTNYSTNRDEVIAETPENAITEPAKDQISGKEPSIEPGEVEVTQPLSPQFAALAKQKRALQVKEREIADREKALESGGVKDGAPELVARLKARPLSVLQELGVTYDQLTEAILGGEQGNPEIQELKAKIAALEKGVETKFQSQEERQEESALTEMLAQAEDLAKEGDAYELIRSEDAYEDVMRMIYTTYKKTGRVLDVSVAMNAVETKLMARAEKLAGINKVRSKLSPPTTTPLQSQPQGMRTLTARDSSTAPLSARQRALAAFAGTLRK